MSVIISGNAFASGLALGSASVLSVGPNSLMMIREGLARGRAGLVASVVLISFASLLGLAFLAAGMLSMDAPFLKSVLSWFGLTALLWFAAGSFRSALRSSDLGGWHDLSQNDRKACALRVLKVVWTNPLTYIETLIAPSALCATLADAVLRFEFIIGIFSVMVPWCYSCAFGGRLCASLLRHHRTLQYFDFASGLLLSFLALALAVELVG